MSAWQQDILDFWFGIPKERHWRRDPELDAEIDCRFGALWEEQRGRNADAFVSSPEAVLAAIILFDQFPRNMFRDDVRAFASDELARAIATDAIARGLDGQVPADRRNFFYMPLQHSERIEDQRRSVALFAALGNAEYLKYAQAHHDVIARFGRFPHRNRVLGREPTEAELAFGEEQPW